MNIIKFKDIIVPDNNVFNEHFKGKYCLWPKLTWAVNFNDVDFNEYVDLEQSVIEPQDIEIPYLVVMPASSEMIDLVDIEATTKANSTSRFEAENKFLPGSDITIEELKQFRSWLASSLLSLQKYDDDTTKSMLEYYQDHMNDEIVRTLRKFSTYFNTSGLNVNYSYSTCGCTNNPTKISKDLLSKELTVYSGCDPIDVYKMGIYSKMVEIFSNMYYWIDGFETKNFLIDFKKYIDNIIDCEFVLGSDNSIYGITDCMCINQNNQEANILILKNLSKSLEYIINDDVIGHKNFISDSFSKWAKNLYEYMEWI